MSKIEKNYATALYELSLENNRLKDDQLVIKGVIEILESNKEFESLLSNAFIDKKDRHKVVDDVFSNYVNKHILSFFHVIIENNRSNHFKGILKEFISLCNEHFNIVEGICYSAFKLSNEQLNKIMKAVSKKEGKEVYLINRTNQELIGGVKIVIGDRIYDGSLSNTIDSIRKNLLA